MKVGDAAAFARYVVKRAPQYQLDANAVVAVAIQEGISGKVGDNGTSFGPFQLHQGGAYPASAPQTPDAANSWAWSPAGVDYALGRMQTVAGGLKGKQAVKAIVYRFERPQNPAAEYAAAVQALPASDGGPSGGGGIGAILSGANTAITTVVPGAGLAESAAGAAGGVVSGAESVASFLGRLTDPHFWLQALEVVGGGVFVLSGLYLLGRQSGVVQKAQGAALTAATIAAPEGKLAKAAAGAGALKRGG